MDSARIYQPIPREKLYQSSTDRWLYLRQKLYRNVEPGLGLIALTQPTASFEEFFTTESLPGFTARASHESKGSLEDDLRLNRDLINWNHTTPFQAVNFVFYVDGITKSLQNQWVRHKIGVGWVYRSTRYVPAEQNEFVYPTYHYLDEEPTVKKLLAIDQLKAKQGIKAYLLKKELGSTKEDCRRIMPVFWNTPCFFFANARAMMNLFVLRIDKTAEWEIRRLHLMFLDVLAKEVPSFFEKFSQKAKKEGWR